MDELFGRRNAELRVAWGSRGAQTTIAEWARGLGFDAAKTRRFYNLEDGCRPRGGIDELARIFAGLRARGGAPRAVATWAWTGDGAMPRPVGGSTVPNVSAPVAPAQPLTMSVRSLLEAVRDGRVSVDQAEAAFTVLAKVGQGSRWLSVKRETFRIINSDDTAAA